MKTKKNDDEIKRCTPNEGMPHAQKARPKKERKRCIPKEGMPHAHKACQKEKKRKIVHIH